MASYDYKIVEWSRYDDDSVKETIIQEATGNWDYYDSVRHHQGRVDLIFREPSN